MLKKIVAIVAICMAMTACVTTPRPTTCNSCNQQNPIKGMKVVDVQMPNQWNDMSDSAKGQ
ncbi:MAG: hypothetical protein ABSB40_13495 [Nitrososphaeria archaeon]|jgi:PBP1b-binding outer membrane lipoprotein LpoB